MGYETGMKDIKSLFTEKLDLMIKLLDESKFENCQQICRSLIATGINLQSKEEVFIFEVLESAFDQIKIIVMAYDVPSEDHKNLDEKLKKCIEDMKNNYTSNSSLELYKVLQECRYIVTNFQFTAWQSYTKKGSSRITVRGGGL